MNRFGQTRVAASNTRKPREVSAIFRHPYVINSLLCLTLQLIAMPAALASKALEEPDDDQIALLYTGDSIANLDGGLQTDARFLQNVDLFTRLRFQSGASLYLHGSYNNGETFSPDVAGDIQVASNIEADEAFRLYQAYYEQGSEDDAAGFLLGLWDLNSRIDVIEPAALFVNSSHGIGAEYALSGELGPSIFPVTALALYGHYRTTSGVTLRGAVLDAVPGDPDKPHRTDIDLSRDDGALLVAEADWTIGERLTAKAGAWQYTSRFAHIDDADRKSHGRGIYGSLAGTLLGDRLAGWVRYGVADDDVQPVGTYLGAGLALSGIPGRPDDRAGIAIASAFAADALRDQGSTRAETNLELTYSAQLTRWVRVQPDIQYIIDPGFRPDGDDALVVALRIELSFSKDF